MSNARIIIQPIYNHFDSDDIDEDDIFTLVDKSKDFYAEVNKTQINVAIGSSNMVKKYAKQIAKAIKDIGAVLDENDPLTILMTFSGDPISDLQPLVELLTQLDSDIEKVEKNLNTRKETLGEVIEGSQLNERYIEELKTVDADMALLISLR